MATDTGALMRLYGGERGGTIVDVLKPQFAAVTEHPMGEPVGFSLADLVERPGADLKLYSLKAGGRYPLHDTTAPVDVVILRGSGLLELGDGTTLSYGAGDVFLFEPGSPHAWHTVTADTLMLGVVASSAGG